MRIGVPKEIKNHEYRVGLTLASVRELVARGHKLMIETNAGNGIGMTDKDYIHAGASIASSAKQVFDQNELIVKVKEPQPNECRMLREDQVLFTYLHLAADAEQTRLLMESGVTAIAYETVTGAENSLPLLAPMSEVAGRLSIQAGAHCLEKAQGGKGILLGGVTGVAPAKVVVIGGGIAGENAAFIARGMGADVTVLDKSLMRLRQLEDKYQGTLKLVYSTTEAIEEYVLSADLVIGSVLIPGAAAPKLVSSNLVSQMKKGAAVVDIAIDQGGCFATSKPTTHQDPTYKVDDIVHYCVTNMPGAVPQTSTHALNNATLPYVIALAEQGYKNAMLNDAGLMNGLNIHRGLVTNLPVAESLGYDYTPAFNIVHEQDNVLRHVG